MVAYDGNQLAADLLRRLKSKAPEAEGRVNVSLGRAQNTRFAVGEITTSGDTDATDLALSVAIGKRHASATTTDLRREGLDALVERAVTMAKLAPEDPEYVPVLGAASYPPSPDDYDDATARPSHELRARAARTVLDDAAKQKVVPAGFFETSALTRTVATSRGLSASHRSSFASLTMTVRTPDGTGSGWAGAEAVRVGAIDTGTLARTAIDKAIRSRQPQSLAPGDYTVVLEPSAVGDLLSYLVWALDARAAHEGRSFFAKGKGDTKLGQPLIAKALSLRSDPLDPRTPGATFDGEGVPLRKTDWFDKGVLRALSFSRYWAQQKQAEPSGSHGTFLLTGGDAVSSGALVKQVKRGLLVTRFWYIRWLSPRDLTVTGLTRDGVFLIENGEVTRPVNNFRFNQSPLEMLANCRAATAASVRVPSWGGSFAVPAVLSERFHMASVSAAV
ncbi:MAG: TldD/PmbA family protein [Polyangiaceae bacterium]